MKKISKQPTIYDVKMEDKVFDFQKAFLRLKKATEAVIIKKNVIELYPDGADKNIAIANFKSAQVELLCAIGHYDSTRADAREYYQEHDKSDFYKDWSKIHFSDSHSLIEETYRDFFKK